MLLTIIDAETYYTNIKLQQKFISGTETLLIKILRRFNTIEMDNNITLGKAIKHEYSLQ